MILLSGKVGHCRRFSLAALKAARLFFCALPQTPGFSTPGILTARPVSCAMTDPAPQPPAPSKPPPPPAPPVVARTPETPAVGRPLSAVESYNVVSDTLIGVNVRGRDNLVQLLAIVAGLVLGAGVGALASPRDRTTGVIAGAFAGLLAGLLLSGFALMIFRGLRHARGRHD